MREIKFRGKQLDNGKWVRGDLRQVEGRAYILDYDIGDDGITDYKRVFNIFYEVDPETVGQYTGRMDKVGAEIYEGDVIKSIHNFYYAFGEERGYTKEGSDRGNWLVTYEGMGFTGLPISDKCIGSALTPQEDYANVEVIGNIHDNADLLPKAIDSTAILNEV